MHAFTLSQSGELEEKRFQDSTWGIAMFRGQTGEAEGSAQEVGGPRSACTATAAGSSVHRSRVASCGDAVQSQGS